MGIPFGAHIPFVEHLGFELTRFDGGHSEIVYTPQPEHLNSFDVVHGGATMTLMDVTMATAARSVATEMGVVTIEMKTTFMRASRGTLRGVGRLIHRTRSMAFTEASIFDADGLLCSQASGTFKYVARQHDGAPSVSTD